MTNNEEKIQQLREKAEEVLQMLESDDQGNEQYDSDKVSKLINELRVHQIELEMQNEELVRAQMELEKSHERFWSLFNNAPVGYLVVDENCMIKRGNITFAQLTGLTMEKIINKPLGQLIDQEDQSIFFSRFKSFFKEAAGKEFELRIKRNSGSFWAILTGRTNLSPEEENSDKSTVLIAVTDVSERKKLEDEQKRLETRMHHFQRLESLGVLAGGIAHDFNNILTVIRGNAEICQMNESAGSTAAPFITEIVKATARAAELTRQMLAYAGKGFFELKSIDFATEVRELTPLLRSSVPTTIDLVIETTDDPFQARCDIGQLHQILINSVINASEAIGDQYGTIRIKTSPTKFSQDSLPNFVLEPENTFNKHLCLEISDDGCGMSQDVMAKIFDPFYSTKFTGRGLGMASIMGIMKRHLGGIAVESVPGKGSTFFFYFPEAKSEEGFSQAFISKKSDQPITTGKFSGKAIIIDDEPEVRDVSSKIFEALGFEVVSVSRGSDALELARRSVDDFRLVVVDLTMPQMNGLDFYFRFRQLSEEVPIIFYSGFPRQSLPDQLQNNPEIGFVQKPFSKKDLEKEINRILG